MKQGHVSQPTTLYLTVAMLTSLILNSLTVDCKEGLVKLKKANGSVVNYKFVFLYFHPGGLMQFSIRITLVM